MEAQSWRNDFRGGGTRLQRVQGDPLKQEKPLDLTNYFSKRVQLSKMIKKIFSKKNIFGPPGGPAPPCSQTFTDQTSHRSSRCQLSLVKVVAFWEKWSKWIYHVFFHGCASRVRAGKRTQAIRIRSSCFGCLATLQPAHLEFKRELSLCRYGWWKVGVLRVLLSF